jgi:hypothetical protein
MTKIVTVITLLCLLGIVSSESKYKAFLKELEVRNPRNEAGLQTFRDAQTSQLRHWVSNMKKYKVNEKCFKRRKKSIKTKTKEQRIFQIVDCNETKANDSIRKFVLSSEELNQGLTEISLF